MQWYLQALRKYADFSGRARRKEYWMFVLFNIIMSFVIVFLEIAIGGFGALYGLYTLAVLLPSVAVVVRRLHDTGRSGWWLLIGIIPLIGTIVLFIFMVLEGDVDSNEFGVDPKLTTP